VTHQWLRINGVNLEPFYEQEKSLTHNKINPKNCVWFLFGLTVPINRISSFKKKILKNI